MRTDWFSTPQLFSALWTPISAGHGSRYTFRIVTKYQKTNGDSLTADSFTMYQDYPTQIVCTELSFAGISLIECSVDVADAGSQTCIVSKPQRRCLHQVTRPFHLLQDITFILWKPKVWLDCWTWVLPFLGSSVVKIS